MGRQFFTFDRSTLSAAVAGCALLFAAGGASAFDAADHAAIEAQIGKRHDEAVKRLQDWIALPSIAAENSNSKEGAEYMARLAREAGFQKAEVIQTEGKPGVFATLDAGAAKTVGLLDAAMAGLRQTEVAVEYGPQSEPWDVRGFCVRDALAEPVNALTHV